VRRSSSSTSFHSRKREGLNPKTLMRENIGCWFFGFITGAAVMLVIMQIMLSSIKRSVRRIRELMEEEKKL